MDSPTNEEGYIPPTSTNDVKERRDPCEAPRDPSSFPPTNNVHSSTCCKHEYMIERLHNLQIGQQRLEFQIQEIKANESKMMWKLIAVIGVTSFLCGYLGVHNWLNLLM